MADKRNGGAGAAAQDAAPARTRPWFKFWVADWLSSSAVAQMTITQEGMYARLLFLAWLATPPCTLPSDDRALAALAKVTLSQWKRDGALVKAQFERVGDRLRNRKQYAVYQEMEKERVFYAARATHAAAARWHRKGSPHSGKDA